MLLSLQNFQINNRVLRILLVAMLIFCMVFCAFVFQLETAHAIALVVPVLAVCSALLIACGAQFDSLDDMQSAASNLYNYILNTDTAKEVLALADAYRNITSGKFVFKATSAMISAVSSWFSAQDWTGFSEVGTTMMGNFNLAGLTNANFQGMNFNSIFMANMTFDKFYDAFDKYGGWLVASNAVLNPAVSISSELLDKPFWYVANGSGNGYFKFIKEGSNFYKVSCDSLGNIDSPSIFPEKILITSIGLFSSAGMYEPRYPYMLYINGNFTWLPVNSVVGEGGVTTFPETEQKTDTTFFPTGVTSGNPSTVFPSGTASKPLTPDIPINVPTDAGTLVGAPAGSTRGDATTGEGDLTIIGWLAKLWDGICSIPGTIAGAITGFFTPPVGLWDGFMDDAVKVMSPPSAVDFTDYVKSISIPDVTGTFKGKTYTFVDNQKLRDNVATWRQYIGAFLAFLILLYNYNMFMKFIGYGGLTLTDSGRVRHEPVDINNLSGAGPSLPPSRGGK